MNYYELLKFLEQNEDQTQNILSPQQQNVNKTDVVPPQQPKTQIAPKKVASLDFRNVRKGQDAAVMIQDSKNDFSTNWKVESFGQKYVRVVKKPSDGVWGTLVIPNTIFLDWQKRFALRNKGTSVQPEIQPQQDQQNEQPQ